MYLFKRCSCRGPCDHPFYFEWQHRGTRYRETTRTANRSLAERIAAKRREAIFHEAAGLELAPTPDPPLRLCPRCGWPEKEATR